jgi:hypothetical protein
MNNNQSKGVTAIARDENSPACPVREGSIFTTAERLEWVEAVEINQRKDDVWSVRVQPVRPVDADGFDWEPFGRERWTSIKVVGNRPSVDVVIY